MELNSKLSEFTINGNVDGVKQCINEGGNIYSWNRDNDTLLYGAAVNGHTAVVNILSNIYKNDLDFIERTVSSNDKFWINSVIVIGFGSKTIESFENLYSEYKKCERDDSDIDKNKCVVFLLKQDNFVYTKVLCLSPKTNKGRTLLVDMLKCTVPDGFLNLIYSSYSYSSLMQATAELGVVNLFEKLLNISGVEMDRRTLILSAIQHGHVNILDTLNKRFPFLTHNTLETDDIFEFIFETDNWPVFKYIVERCIADTQFTFQDIINKTVPYEELTVFERLVVINFVNVAENCWQYGPDLTNWSEFYRQIQNSDVLYSTASRNLLQNIIKFDRQENYDDEFRKVQIDFFRDLVQAASFEIVCEIYKKFSSIGQQFFKNSELGLLYIQALLEERQDDKIKLVMANCIDQLDMYTFVSIVIAIAESQRDNNELFAYVMSLKEDSFSLVPISSVIQSAIRYCNYHVLAMVLAESDYDSNKLRMGAIYSTPQETLNDFKLFKKRFYKLLHSGSSYNTVNPDYTLRKNQLHYTVYYNHFYATKKLLELGVDMNLYNAYGELPIHCVTSVEMLDLLNNWTSTSYINVKTKQHNRSLLHLHARTSNNKNSCSLIKYILDNGGNINAIDDEGRSPIFYVIDIKIAKLLLEYKPNLDLSDRYGNTPLIHFMCQTISHSHDIVDLLYQYQLGSHNNASLWLSLERKCNDNTLDDPFLIKTIDKCRQCARILLNIPNLNVCVQTCRKFTSLHFASKYCDVDLCEQLLARGLSIDDQNDNGNTAFHLYCQSFTKNTYGSIMRLLQFNPDINVKGYYGTTPIWHATKMTYGYDIVCELLTRGANMMDACLDGKTAYSNLSSEMQTLFKFLT